VAPACDSDRRAARSENPLSTIDRGDSHYADAGGWLEACYHLGVFLRWAVRRGLAAASHVEQAKSLSESPGAYVVQQCDGKLLIDDFCTDAWLVQSLYGRFLPRYARRVHQALGTEYVAGLDDALVREIERELDRDLQRLRPATTAEGGKSPAEPSGAASVASTASVASVASGSSGPTPTPRRVRHPKFGEGVVVATTHEGGRERVTVEFEGSGRRTLLASFVEPVD